MQCCSAFRKEFEQLLVADIGKNIPLYCSDDCWIQQWAGQNVVLMSTPVEILNPLELRFSDGKTHFDVENAMQVFSSLRKLTPTQAADERLWAWLTHVYCWGYMRSRWPIDLKVKAGNDPVKIIRERYFVTTRRSLTRNGIARLWWYVWLTHRPDDSDPFRYTKVLLSKLDVTQSLLERSFGKCREVRMSFLDFLMTHQDECLNGGNRSRIIVRQLAKALNFRGGFGLLDAVRADAMQSFLAKQLDVALSESDGLEPQADEVGEVDVG